MRSCEAVKAVFEGVRSCETHLSPLKGESVSVAPAHRLAHSFDAPQPFPVWRPSDASCDATTHETERDRCPLALVWPCTGCADWCTEAANAVAHVALGDTHVAAGKVEGKVHAS